MIKKQENALRVLANDIYKSALKIPYHKLHYPGYYPANEYFVCDSFRLLHCTYFEELPLRKIDFFEDKMDYPGMWKRQIAGEWQQVRLPTEKELKAVIQKHKDFIMMNQNKLSVPQKSYALWHFGEKVYVRADWILKAIKAMKDPIGKIQISRGVTRPLYICSETDGTELIILNFKPTEFGVKHFYRLENLEIIK